MSSSWHDCEEMVLPKRLDYGFNGFQVPVTPRAPRSARKRRTISKRVEDNSMGAFDLLATVAGKLLLDKESSPASSHTSTGEEKPLKVEPSDQGSCDRKFVVSDNVSQEESPVHQNDSHSVMTSSNCSERFVSDVLVGGKCKNEIGSFTSEIPAGFSLYRESGECKLDGEAKVIVKDETDKMRGAVPIGTAGADNVEDPMIWEGKAPALVSSDSSTKVPICVEQSPQKPILASRDDIKIVSRDDDENSSGCTHPNTTTRYLRTTPHIGDRRIKKILASRYWKAAPKMKEEARYNSYRDMRPMMYQSRKNGYKCQRSQMTVPFKKRRLFDRSTVMKSVGGVTSESFFDSANAVSSSVAGQRSAFKSRNSHVKLRIKSFRVPELFIEIPETATVGSLKKTVMDAVTAVLGGGLCVGVLLQGRKVRDDTKTLQQTGISQDDQLDSVGFSLEPKPSHTPTQLCSAESPRMLPSDVVQPLTRYAPDPSCEASLEPPMALGSFVESDHDSAPSPTDTSTTDSKALGVMSGMSADALAIVPWNRKSKRFDIGQRRIRRPFSVSEVEALVQAVEKLGTGRWRDVKMRAFENAKHRTYVDLKDKWKTLVHTARISPQQRRGEPVPQELLDRVLNALIGPSSKLNNSSNTPRAAFWSEQKMGKSGLEAVRLEVSN